MRMLTIIFFLVVLLGVPALSQGQPRGPQGMMGQGMMGPGMLRGGPYGNYCPEMKWGPYGVRKPVRNAAEARQVIETYLSDTAQEARVGKIQEKKLYFEAEILDQKGELIDREIVDKRTGRIRSIY